jgi:hypothetical protein
VALQHHDPGQPYVEQYRVDRAQFKSLYVLLVPWLCGLHTDTVAHRTFTLLDQDRDLLITFRKFAGWLGIYFKHLFETETMYNKTQVSEVRRVALHQI